MRCFFGIPVDNPDAFAEVQNFLASQGIRMIPKQNLHITFIFLGEVSELFTQKMVGFMKTTALGHPTIKPDRIVGLPKDTKARVIALKLLSPDLVALYDQISREISFSEDRRYMPHITLARVRTQITMNSIGPYQEDLPQVKVSRLALFESTLKPDGATYREIFSSQFM